MKLKINKEEILKGLQRIQGVVEKKNTMPILSNMLLTADGNGVEIIATDLGDRTARTVCCGGGETRSRHGVRKEDV